MTSTLADQLSAAITKTLEQFQSRIDEPIKILALDFHPWNGFLALAVLTEAEVASDPLLEDLAEMAAWKHYDFGANLAEWDVMPVLTEMQSIYQKNKDAESLFRCCASAMASSSVQQAVSSYNLADGFRISVANIDDNREYYS